jgi:hypothetical protein
MNRPVFDVLGCGLLIVGGLTACEAQTRPRLGAGPTAQPAATQSASGTVAPDEQAVAALIQQLTATGGNESMEKLIAMGPAVRPLLKAKLQEKDLAPSVCDRLTFVISQLGAPKAVAAMKALRSLGARVTTHVDEIPGEEAIAVDFSGANPLTNDDLLLLKDLDVPGATQLQEMILVGTGITDAGLVHLEGLTHLAYLILALDGSQVTDAGLEHLKGLTSLQYLFVLGPQITDAGLKHLKDKELPQLTHLVLDDTKVTDAGLKHFIGWTHLFNLALNGTKVTDAGLEVLKGMPQLHYVALERSGVTDHGVEQLKALTLLDDLRLGDTKVTDAGLEHLKGLAQLQNLTLENTQVTDAGLANLKGLTKLKRLDLQGTKVTEEGRKKLQEALPDCKILH